ncbi:hypothetical protein KBI33_02515 [Candidatus Shapirobacteria bacterium]|nr:hypothetical protein [Candidatus Shapirobacteria bacterium]
MESALQVLLVVVIVILTALLTVIGVQIFQILQEVKKAIKNFNEALNPFLVFSQKLSRPFLGIGGFIEGLGSFLEVFSGKSKKKQEEKGEKKNGGKKED